MLRGLNYGDVSKSYQRTDVELRRIGERLIAALQAAAAADRMTVGPLGICYRGGSVYDNVIAHGWTVDELTAVWVLNRRGGFNGTLERSLEIATGEDGRGCHTVARKSGDAPIGAPRDTTARSTATQAWLPTFEGAAPVAEVVGLLSNHDVEASKGV